MNHGADSCARFDALLLDYAYGELEGAARLELEAHLAGCAACRASHETIGTTRRTMQALASQPAPEAGLESLLAYAQKSAARGATAPVRRGWRWLVPAMSAGGVGLVLALVVAGERNPSDRVLPAVPVMAAAPSAQPSPPSSPAMPAVPAVPAATPEYPAAEKPVSPVDVAPEGEPKLFRADRSMAPPPARPEKKDVAPRAKAASRAVAPSAFGAAGGAAPADEEMNALAGLVPSGGDAVSAKPQAAAAVPPAPVAQAARGYAEPTAARIASEESARELADSDVEAAKQEERSGSGFEAAQPAASLKRKSSAVPAKSSDDDESPASSGALPADAALAMARGASERGEYGLAAEILSRALAESDDHRRTADLAWALARTYERAGDLPRAQAAYARFLARFPSDARAHAADAAVARIRSTAHAAGESENAPGAPAAAPVAPAQPVPVP